MGYGEFGGNRGHSGGFGNRGPMVPVKVGDELDVTIEAVGEKGDGIAKIRGFVIFIPNVSEGDQVKIRVTKVFRKVGFAEVIGAGEAKAVAEEEKAPEESESFGEEEETSEEPAEPEKEEEAKPETEEEPSGEESDSFGDDELPEPEGEEK